MGRTGTHTVITDSNTTSRPQFLPGPNAWAGKAYIKAYIERFRSVYDGFRFQARGAIVKPSVFCVQDTQYFYELKHLYYYGGFEWPTIFSHIKPKR